MLYNNYPVIVAINLTHDYEGSNKIKLGTIHISTDDSYDDIIGNINQLLDSIYLTVVSDFHYIEKDGDINYANRLNFHKDDLCNALKYNTTFYVYYKY